MSYKNLKSKIIAIDGPAGAGKSTVAKILAKKLGFLYIDTGAMYRALTLKTIREKVDLKDTDKLVDMTFDTYIDLENDSNGSLRVFLDSQDVTEEIRDPTVTKLVSDLAKIKEIRDIMLELQRKLGVLRDSVLDGRDIGTVVFPDADKKFYIDADFDERVRRRYKELRELGQNVTFKEVEEDLYNRDTIDSQRQFAPLKRAGDAVYIDTTDMTVEEVVDRILKVIS